MKSVRTVFAAALLAAPLPMIIGVAVAGAATLTVQAGAPDNAGCNPAAPHPTITQAIGCAADGDTISVGAGTFTERVTIDKDVVVNGAGIGQTFIDGGGVDTLAGPGQVYVIADGDATLSNLTVRNAGANNANPSTGHYSIYDRGPTDGSDATGTHTFSDIAVVGGGAGRPDTGYYCFQNTGNVIIENSSFTAIAGNHLLFENCTGAVRVAGNDFDQSLVADAAMYSMRYSGFESAEPQLVTGNSFSGAGISYNGSFFGLEGTVGRFTGIDITDNSFEGMAIGVGLFNRATVGANGQIDDVAISGNLFTGTGTSQAVRLTGLISDVALTANTIVAQAIGIQVIPQPANGHIPTGTTAEGNRIVGNTVGANATAPAALDAERNFWGCNEGPGETGCDTVTGDVDADPWLQLAFAPAPATSVTSGATTDFGVTTWVDSDGDDVAFGVPGTPAVTFAATGGSVTPTDAVLDEGIFASVTFRAGAGTGAAQVSATLDNATITSGITVVAGPVTPGSSAPRALPAVPATASPTFVG